MRFNWLLGQDFLVMTEHYCMYKLSVQGIYNLCF